MSFEKIMLMTKEVQNDGTERIYRIPWDIVNYNEVTGLSPVGVLSNFEHRVATAVYISRIESVLLKMQDNPVPNEIIDIQWFESEQEFMVLNDNTTMYYDSDSGQSKEAGYPRV